MKPLTIAAFALAVILLAPSCERQPWDQVKVLHHHGHGESHEAGHEKDGHADAAKEDDSQ